MLIEAHPVSPWQSNCCLVADEGPATGDTTPCIIIDPGIMSFDVIVGALERLNWQPVVVLLTHGHLDHAGDAHRVAASWNVPVHCAQEDQPMLARPSLGLGESSVPLIEQFFGADSLPLPAQMRPFDEAFVVAGLTVTPFAAPGHTAGSILLEVSDGTSHVLFTGDVLFAGTIGRTDLPSGNMEQMRETLSQIEVSFPKDIPVLPGHGSDTTLAKELASNPFMQDTM